MITPRMLFWNPTQSNAAVLTLLSKLNNSSCFCLPDSCLCQSETLPHICPSDLNKLLRQFTIWRNILLNIFFLFLFLASCLDVQRQRPDHTLPWGKPDTRQATADVMSHKTSGQFLWCHIPLLTALKWWRGRERLTTEGDVVWKGETVVAGGRGVDEKKRWCLSSAALLFSLMFPLLSAVGVVSSNHTHSERLWRW